MTEIQKNSSPIVFIGWKQQSINYQNGKAKFDLVSMFYPHIRALEAEKSVISTESRR